MANEQFSFFSAGLPGLTFGIGLVICLFGELGQGLPVQHDGTTTTDAKDDAYEEEQDILIKNSLLPRGLLAIRVFGCQALTCQGFEDDAELHVYVQLTVGSCKKSTQPIYLENARPIWNETKLFPVVLHPFPQSRVNEITISLIAYDKSQETFLTPAKHKLAGLLKFDLHKVIKSITSCEVVDILDRKQQSFGKMELEFAFSYGNLGYGLSHQLENNMHTPKEMVKHCFLPKIESYHESPLYRGLPTLPSRIDHPDIIPFDNKVTDLEPEISDSFGFLYEHAASFPLVKQNMERIAQLRSNAVRLGSRVKRIGYLRSVLQDKDPQLSVDQDTSDNDEPTDSQAPIPSALAIMMTSSLLANAPGVTRRSISSVPAPGPSNEPSSTIYEQEEADGK